MLKNSFFKIFILIFFILMACDKNENKQSKHLALNEIDSVEINFSDKLNIGRHKFSLKRLSDFEVIIKKYAYRYDVDWRLIVAMILKESQFKVNAKSPLGAQGLMQIMPATEGDLSKELEIEFISKRPEENIEAGIFHFSKQIEFFKEFSDAHTRLKYALASYNAGIGRVWDAQSIADYLKMDRENWDSLRICFSKLARTEYRIHLGVWPEGIPKYGYLNNHKETTEYVDIIWELYQQLILRFPENLNDNEIEKGD